MQSQLLNSASHFHIGLRTVQHSVARSAASAPQKARRRQADGGVLRLYM